jgi:carbamoyltransferase
MKVLGISAHYHDSAAALLVDGLPVCAVQEERLSRHKNDAGFPAAAIEWCLAQANIESEDLDAVVFYDAACAFERILTCMLRTFHSWRSFPAAIKNSWREGLGARHRRVVLGVPRRPRSSSPGIITRMRAAF